MRHFFEPILLFAVFLICSCSEDNYKADNIKSSSLTISLQMPNSKSSTSQRRVNLHSINKSKDMKAEWEEGDKVQAILRHGNEIYNLGFSKVANISEDKRTAIVTFDKRATPNVKPPYTIFLLTGNKYEASADAIGGGNWAAYCNYELQRSPGGYFHAPLFCQLVVKSDGIVPEAKFQHFGTYEILHVYNTTNMPITFVHQGFEVERPWYQASTTVWFYDDFDFSPHGEWDGEAESQSMVVMPNSENIIYSWYIPSGFPVDNARLIANINGNYGIQSTNTLTSSVLPQRGCAYHMYALWDGKQLIFVNGDDNEHGSAESETFTVNGVSFNMVAVEGGTFMMGSEDDDPDAGGIYSDEKPQHKVYVSSFAIGETEVTQELWKTIMNSNPSEFKGEKLPVENVSWDDCQVFISKLNNLTGRQFRLPTEAEWEYAARGGKYSKGYRYSGGNDVDVVAWNWENCNGSTQIVGTKPANELGLYDMSGNVFEWCLDWYDYNYYEYSPLNNPCNTEKTSEYRIHRGGNIEYIKKDLRVAMRGDYVNELSNRLRGFRLVLEGGGASGNQEGGTGTGTGTGGDNSGSGSSGRGKERK